MIQKQVLCLIKDLNAEKAKQKIGLLTEHIQVINTEKQEVQSTLLDKRIHDFEDGLEYHSALNARCHIIVTEDQDDFYFSSISVMSCSGILRKVLLNF